MLTPVPDYLSLLSDIKCLFSLKMDNQQENDYQCLLVWARQMPQLQLQLSANSYSNELQLELINLLRPVQQALSNSLQITKDNPVKKTALSSLNNYVTDFYKYLPDLPKSRSQSTILKEWQDANGHGSIPPLQPMPQPILENSQPPSPYSSLFSSEVKWQKGDNVNHEYPCLTHTSNP